MANIISFGQNSDAWKKILFNSTTFKIKHDKNKIPDDIIGRILDTITDIANPKEKINCETPGTPHYKLKWFAVDNDEHYIIFATIYCWKDMNLCFLLTKNAKGKPLVVEKIQGDLNFKEFKTVFINHDLKVGEWDSELYLD